MRKFILPVLFTGIMLLNAALFVFITDEFDGSKVTSKHVVRPEPRQR